MRTGDTLMLDLPEPEFTEAQLRAAHDKLKLKRPFEDCMQTLWLPPLLRCCARDMARRAAKGCKAIASATRHQPQRHSDGESSPSITTTGDPT